MSTPYTVKPYEYAGWWELPHMDHLRRTKRMLTSIKERVAALTALQTAHEAVHGEDSYDWKPHYEEIALLKDMALAVQLFCYLEVEGFLNHYGVVRLGEKYYMANLERIEPVQRKVAAILLATERVVIPSDHRLICLVQLMFKRRNELVHPKPKQLAIGRAVNYRGLDHVHKDAQEAADHVEEFFALFSTFHTSGFPVRIP